MSKRGKVSSGGGVIIVGLFRESCSLVVLCFGRSWEVEVKFISFFGFLMFLVVFLVG